ncbi:SAM-dependent methyltransferase [Pedococcus bigeumensis]|uniref:Class I SAM-dependent methyltransferase n=1 Tax=Pedococcus bigeumensis TaxID=433644 RepID=A0A502CW42_9MICO|nr:class I SAM-dependent methyltransferase [Pedococcus bigeumensis]TPG16046.1 class I SAM-dependent methyltransferase [Pedococcus bigeumensis]
MTEFELSQSQAHALLLQRTGYQSTLVGLVKRAGLTRWYDARVAARTSTRRRVDLAGRYAEECRREAESLAQVLPETGVVMDIGCGLGGPDLALARAVPGLSFVLLDKDEFDDRPHYGFEAEASAYNSLAQTVEFITANGVAPARLETVDIARQPFPAERPVDAVISIMSWGFHYPLSTYLDQVHAVLRPGGVVVVDVRTGTDAEAELRGAFGEDAVRRVATPHTAFPRLLATKSA